ncbi:putative siderophore-binding lipoprotein YfiY [Starkeya nomas]|uniref:Putative siderophore-binding lipoprotein YfiY n=1 Tax=Starkeya nomas TaxID=2666134 RepID=A0A5S9Q5Z4_9HYPH|nr:iron-siderophore ABC transporter substrate-binding protein [Starkeya nomas]CAA0112628.1 putative siderophore-binding lipoprotein YfiY [Starkeya nomas]
MQRAVAAALITVMAGAVFAPAALAACEGRIVATHIMGEPVCVPAHPQRIVTLDPLLSLGMLRELGVPFVGVPMLGIQDQEIRGEVETQNVVDLGHPLQPDLERIAGLNPDLIIGASYLHGQSLGNIARIAPTLLIEHIDWKEHLRLVARITGKSAEADEIIGTYETRAAAIRARVPNLRVSVVRISPTGFQVYLDGPAAYGPYAVLREAGVRRTDYEVTADTTIVKRPDWEELAALDGDVLLYVPVNGYDPAQDDALEVATVANPFWQMLPAVSAGRAHRVGRGPWMGFAGATSAHKVLDDIERYVLPTP